MGNRNVCCPPTGTTSIVACYRIGANTVIPVEIVRFEGGSKPPRVFRLGTLERIVPVDPDRLMIPGGCDPAAANVVEELTLDGDQVLTLTQTGGDDVTVDLSDLSGVDDVQYDPETMNLVVTYTDGTDPSVLDLSSLASDFYADSVTFDPETGVLTINRTGGLPPLTVDLSGIALPDGAENQIITYDAAGNPVVQFATVLNFVGEMPEDFVPGTYFPASAVGAAGDVLDQFPMRAAQSPAPNTIPERTDTGALRAQDPVGAFDLVNLRTLEDTVVTYPIDAPDRGTGNAPSAGYAGSFVAGYGAEEVASVGTPIAPGIVIGYNAKSLRGAGNVSIGYDAQTTANSDGGGDMIALGSAADSYGQHSIAIGAQTEAGDSVANRQWGVAIGSGAKAKGQQSTAIGRTASATGTQSIAIGLNADASNNQSIALGPSAVTSRDDEVSVGAPGNERFVANVADPVEPQDAMTRAYFEANIPAALTGTYPQVATFDAGGAETAGYLDLDHLVGEGYEDIGDASGMLLWTTFIAGGSRINTVIEATNRPDTDNNITQVPMRVLVGAGTSDPTFNIYSDTVPDNILPEPTDDIVLVNKAYLREKLPNFHAEEVGIGAQIDVDLTTIGETVTPSACITIDNTTGDVDMKGMARFTTFSPAMRRVGNGSMFFMEQISLDGGTTWVDLAENRYERSGTAVFTTNEVVQLTRASEITVPAGTSLTFCSRVVIAVDLAHGAGSTVPVGHELEVIAGAQRP